MDTLEKNPLKNFSTAEDEKAVQMMFYVPYGIFWGTVITKKVVRLSTWLRGVSAPDNIRILDAKGLITTAGGQPKPNVFLETNIPTQYINAYHILPPAQESADYDESEPNRKMVPATLAIGTFLCRCQLRIASVQTLDKFLDVTHEEFISAYNAEIFCPVMPSLGTLKTPLLQVRRSNTISSISLD